MSVKKKAASKIFIGLFFRALVSLRGLILIPIIVKTAGETVYGGYVIILSVFTIIFGISSFGIDFTTWRYLPSASIKEEKQKLFYSLITFQLLSVLILSLIFIIFYKWFDVYLLKKEVVFSKWIILGYLISYVLFSQGTNYFRYTFRSNYYFIGTFLVSFGSVLLILLYFESFGKVSINVIIDSVILMAIIIVAFTFSKIVKEIGFIFYLPPFKDFVGRIRLGFPMVTWFLINTILSSSDRYIILAFMKLSDVGYYAVAYGVGSLLFIFSSVAEIIIQPIVNKEMDLHNKESIIKIINLIIKVYLIICIPFIIGTIFYAKPLIVLLANQGVAEHASKLVPYISAGIMFYGLGMIMTIILIAELKTKSILKANLLAAIFNIITNIILLYFFHNIMVAAITTALSYILSFIYILFTLSKRWNFFSLGVSLMIKLVAISFILIEGIIYLFGFLGNLISNNLSFFVQVFIFILLYFSIIYIIGFFSKKDIEIMKQMYIQTT